MLKLELFSSSDCCLCDDALKIIESLSSEKKLRVDKVDIYQNKSLLIKYRVSIPVVKHADSDSEIRWPFDLEQFSNWLKSLPSQ